MGFSIESSHVQAFLFNSNGKHKYEVCLDYSDQTREDFEHWDMHANAKRALRSATEKGISGVSFTEVPPSWFLVVPEPYSKFEYPIMVTGNSTPTFTI